MSADSRSRMRALDTAEIAKLLDATDDPGFRTLLALSIALGLRQSEALGLRWSDIDLGASLLRVRHQLDRDGKLVAPKTEQAKREIVLGPALVAMLREHKLRSLRSQPSDFAFGDGSPAHFRIVRKLAAAAERAGLHGEGQTKLRWHDLRHTAVSMLVASGLDIVFISRTLGHSNPSITLNVYGHLFDREQHGDRARATMDAAIGGTP